MTTKHGTITTHPAATSSSSADSCSEVVGVMAAACSECENPNEGNHADILSAESEPDGSESESENVSIDESESRTSSQEEDNCEEEIPETVVDVDRVEINIVKVKDRVTDEETRAWIRKTPTGKDSTDKWTFTESESTGWSRRFG